jgi:D-alanyl-D-alanine carboxypeptidase
MDGKVLVEKNADSVRPIASITKLVTTRVAETQDPTELIEILREDMKAGRMRTTPLKVGEKYPRALLMELALVSSDNVAALALGRTENLQINLPESTVIVEASGLDSANVSSARDIATIARGLAHSSIARTSVQPFVTIGDRNRKSTNPLLEKSGWAFHLSKTGFMNASGGCLVVIFEAGGRLVTAVILGSRDVPTRWRDLYELRKMIDETSDFDPPKVKPKSVTKKKRRYK